MDYKNTTKLSSEFYTLSPHVGIYEIFFSFIFAANKKLKKKVKYNFEVLDKFFVEHRDNFHYNK